MRYGKFALAGLLVLAASQVQAQTTGFVNNPTTNSSDFQTFVTGFGATVNTNVNFNSHPTGALQSNFYSVSDGVTLTGTGNIGTVVNGAGPNDGNNSTAPLSPGEGPHAVSNYLAAGTGSGTLTLSFAAPVSGVGLFTADLFNPGGADPLTLAAFAGANGTGTLLGSFNAAAFNFQPNNLYFLGIASTNGTNSIGSVVFTHSGTANDNIAIDDIRFSRVPAAVPEPGSVAMLVGMGISGAGFLLRRRKK